MQLIDAIQIMLDLAERDMMKFIFHWSWDCGHAEVFCAQRGRPDHTQSEWIVPGTIPQE